MVLWDILIRKKLLNAFRIELLLSLLTRLFTFLIPVNHEHYSSLDDIFTHKKDVNENRSSSYLHLYVIVLAISEYARRLIKPRYKKYTKKIDNRYSSFFNKNVLRMKIIIHLE